MTTVLMVSGSWPPAAYDVGDYTELLCRNLESTGIEVARYQNAAFSRLWSSAILSDIAATACDLIHIQYSTAGYGISLAPGAIARRIRTKPIVVTLHHYASFRPYRKPWFNSFARYCATRIFTAALDRSLFAARFPNRGGFDTTIEIPNAHVRWDSITARHAELYGRLQGLADEMPSVRAVLA